MCTHFETMRISLNFNFSRKRKCESVQSLSCVQLFVTPWTVAHQAPLSVGFSRQQYWSGLPTGGTPPMAKVVRKEARHYTKGRSSLRRPPVPEDLPPKPESAYFTALCSHLHLWLYGGLSPTTSLSEGVNLQLQSIKIPGRDKTVSTYKLLWRFSSLPEQVHPATCDCLQPPNCERHEML